MKDKSWRFSQRAAVTAVSLVLGTAAQAGNVRGNLDPNGANDIPPYNGFAIFNVPVPCLNAAAGWHGTAGCGIVMESATIYLYSGGNGGAPNLPPGSASPASLLDTLNFGAQSPSYIFGFLVDGAGHLLGLDSALSAGVFSSPFSRDYFLSFESGCVDAPAGDPVCDPPIITELAFLFAPTDVIPTAANPAGILSDDHGNSSRTTALTFVNITQAVPEPGTVSLILGALGGGWLARRRKKKLAA